MLFPDGVRVLHDGGDATVDICFVHDLTGNRDTTGTAKGHTELWPRTLLNRSSALSCIGPSPYRGSQPRRASV
ncbi:hypothetical protein RBB50_012702 [Rhinocladiella similis]